MQAYRNVDTGHWTRQNAQIRICLIKHAIGNTLIKWIDYGNRQRLLWIIYVCGPCGGMCEYMERNRCTGCRLPQPHTVHCLRCIQRSHIGSVTSNQFELRMQQPLVKAVCRLSSHLRVIEFSGLGEGGRGNKRKTQQFQVLQQLWFWLVFAHHH